MGTRAPAPGTALPVDCGHLFAGPAQREVFGIAAAPRRPDLRPVHQRRDPALEGPPLLVARQQPIGVGGLRRQPRPCLRRGLIFEPAIGIRERLAVDGVDDRRHPRLWRRFESRALGTTGRPDGDGDQGDDERGADGASAAHGATLYNGPGHQDATSSASTGAKKEGRLGRAPRRVSEVDGAAGVSANGGCRPSLADRRG